MISKLGHYGMSIITAVLLIAIASLWLPLSLAWMVLVVVVLVVVVLLTFVGMRRHNRWCDRCATPLNPEASVRRNRVELKIVHLPEVFTGIYILGLIAATVVVVGDTSTLSIVIWSVTMLSLSYVLRANVVHHRLRPWCPKCREGGSGKDILDPMPLDGLYV